MASLTRRGAAYRLHWRENGKQRTATYPNKREALTAQRAIDARLDARKPASSRPTIPLAELAHRYLAQRASKYNDEDRRTIARALENHTHWQHPADPTRDELLALPIGQYRLVRAILRYAASIGQPVDPCLPLLRRPGPARKPKPALITSSQVSAALERAQLWGHAQHLAVHLIAAYGHRPVSIAGLSIAALNTATQVLTLPIKSGDIHAHPVLPATANLWRLAAGGRPSTEHILLHSGGEPWKDGRSLANWYYNHIGRIAHPEDPGIYALKRWCISHLLGSEDAKTVASIMGHRTISILQNTYARTNETRQRAALAAIEKHLSDI